jgi:hypothetical protein
VMGKRGWPNVRVCRHSPLVRLMAREAKHVISPTRLSIGFLPLLALIIATVFHSQEESGFVAAGLMCPRTGLSGAVPAAVLFWLLLRVARFCLLA